MEETNERSFSMSSILGTILLGGILLLGTLSCATAPKESLARGE